MNLFEPEIVEGEQDNEDYVLRNGDIQKLTDAIEKLNQILIEQSSTEEESEEESSEESTEEVVIPEEDMPLQKKDLDKVVDSINGLNKSVDKLVEYQENQIKEKEHEKEESFEKSRGGIVFLDETVDNHLYLTSEVENADINDLYTMTLSIRNVCVLAFLLFLVLFFFRLCRTVLERALNR